MSSMTTAFSLEMGGCVLRDTPQDGSPGTMHLSTLFLERSNV